MFNSLLSNPLFVAGFNALDKAGPIVQLGVGAAVLIVAAAFIGFAISNTLSICEDGIRRLCKPFLPGSPCAVTQM